MSTIRPRTRGGNSGGQDMGAADAFKKAMRNGKSQKSNSSAEPQDEAIMALADSVSQEAERVGAKAQGVKEQLQDDSSMDQRAMMSAEQSLGEVMQTLQQQTRKVTAMAAETATGATATGNAPPGQANQRRTSPDQDDDDNDSDDKSEKLKNQLKGLFSLLNTLAIMLDALSGQISQGGHSQNNGTGQGNSEKKAKDLSKAMDTGEGGGVDRSIYEGIVRMTTRMGLLMDLIDEIEGGVNQIRHHGEGSEHSADQSRWHKNQGEALPYEENWSANWPADRLR